MLIFIDGAEGATGLLLEKRLIELPGVELIKPEAGLRKDINSRREYLNRADAAFLCLPDKAAAEAVSLVENPDTVVVDASTAHRTAPGWAYGFPELSPAHYEAVRTSNRIAVPGCHASGFCALVYPLVTAGAIRPDEILFCNSLTGYSGGGKSMISEYESGVTATAARAYALGLQHKHLPEMTRVCGLNNPPIFQPVIVNARQGMQVSVPLARDASYIWEILDRHYCGAENVTVKPLGCCETLDLELLNGTGNMEIYVFGNTRQTVMTALFDNLGKGSSGAAVQCIKIRKGLI